MHVLRGHEYSIADPINMTEGSPDTGDRETPDDARAVVVANATASDENADTSSSSDSEAPIANDDGATEGLALGAPGRGSQVKDDVGEDEGEGDEDGGEEEEEEEEEGEEEEDEDEEDDNDDDDDDDDEEDEEPKFKYARLTPHLSSVYRNGNSTSSFLVAGDKMVGAASPTVQPAP